jgi:hypothetical protein
MATQTTQTNVLPWVQPYMQDYLSRAQGVANAPYTQSPTQVTGPNNYLQSGWDAIARRAAEGSPVMGAANRTLTDTINGRYLNNNPYVQQNVNNAQADLVNSWNNTAKPSWETAALGSGSFGNTGVSQAMTGAQSELQKNLGRVSTDIRSNAYNTERGMQQQALGYAPQFANQDYVDANQLLTAGTQRQGYQDRNAAQNYAWWQEANQYPIDRLNVLGNALGLGAQSGTQQQAPGVSRGSSIIGGALAGSQLGGMLGLGSGMGAGLGGLFGLFGG